MNYALCIEKKLLSVVSCLLTFTIFVAGLKLVDQ